MRNEIEYISVWQWTGKNAENIYDVHFRRKGSEARRYVSPSKTSMRRFRNLLNDHAKGHQVSLVDNFIHIQAYPVK